jgi:hypothetical protein
LSRELDRELDSKLDSELSNELHSKLGSKLRTELIKSKAHWLFLTAEYTRIYLMWYKFIKDEFNISCKKEKELDFLYENINKANIAKTFLCEKVVLVLRMPSKILRNSNGFHCITEEGAIQYNGEKHHYINGVSIKESMMNSLLEKTYTFEDFVKEPNEEIKFAALSFMSEKWGEQYVIDFLKENLKEVNTYVDKKDSQYLEGTTKGMNIGVYTLFKGKINDVELAYVRCYCPSTDRMFFLGVHPQNKNAKDAIASLYRVPKFLVQEITSIQRQGEVFSTNFTEKGLSLLKTLTKQDIANTVSISGNDYFKLLKYEY